MCVVCTITRGHAEVSVVSANVGDHVDVRGPCCCQTPCGSSQSMLLLPVKDKEATFSVASMAGD